MKRPTFRWLLALQLFLSFGTITVQFIFSAVNKSFFVMTGAAEFIFNQLLPITGILLGLFYFFYLTKQLPVLRWLNFIVAMVAIGFYIEYILLYSFAKAGGG